MKSLKIAGLFLLGIVAAVAAHYHPQLLSIGGIPLLLGITNTPAGAAQAPNSAANSFNATNCDPRFLGFDDAMSITRVNIQGWNKSDIESQMFKEIGLDKIIAQTKEARMAGTKQRTLTDLLLSRNAPLKMGGGVNNGSIIQPFRLVPRRNRVNPGYFRVSAGAATSASNGAKVALPAGVTSGALWTLTVNNGSLDNDSSPFAKSPNNVLKNIERYFLPRHNITCEFITSSNVKVTSVCKIIAAFNVDANQAQVVVAPTRTFQGDAGIYAPGYNSPNNSISGGGFPLGGNNSSATAGWWESASGAATSVFQATTGIVKIGANAVSDYEQYGNALPGYNEYGLIEYWPQTMRWTHKYNDEYVKALTAATTSDGLKKFRLLPLAKLRAQQEKFMEDFMFETCFYGDIITENQTTTNWQNLPQVNDPAWAASGENGTLPIEFLTNTVGIRSQINACGNVLDNQAGPLDLDSLFEAGYYVKREREGESGTEVSEIDIMTDLRFTRPLLRQIMTKYYKAKYGLDNITGYAQINQHITFNGAVMFSYDSYDLPDYGYTLNVFSDQYFDDKVAQFQTAQKSAGRGIWMIDWSDININIIKAMSVPRTNNLADNVYKYVIQQNVQHVLLNSKKFEVAIGNSNRHRIIENYSDRCAKITVPGCDLTES